MERDKSNSGSLNQYFENDSNDKNFFDQVSQQNTSAMMTSFIQSNSTQDLREQDRASPDPTTSVLRLDGLSLDSEPKVCKIFSEGKSGDKSIFDILSPSSPVFEDGDPTGKGNTDRFSPAASLLNYDCNKEGPYPSALQGFEDVSDPLNGTESDRTRESWIPSDATRRALIKAATSPPGTYVPEKNMLTSPCIFLEEDLMDGVTALVRDIFGEEEASQRKVLTMFDVSQDENGVRELIQAECFRAAVNLIRKLLIPYGQNTNKQNQPTKCTHTVHSIQLWFTRLCLLVKLNLFEDAYNESLPWWNLDRPDLYYQFYPGIYGGKLGTMVPFQMRLLIANMPAYMKKFSEAFDRLYSVLAVVRQILNNLETGKSEDGSLIELTSKERDIAKRVWSSREARVQHSIVNVALMAKNYVLAIEIMQTLINKNYSLNQKRALQSALGRIFLQLGDVSNAEKCFALAKQLKRQQQGTLSTSTADLRELVDKGLLHVADNQYSKAYEYFQKASLLDPTNVMVLNNMAVCLLYTGQLKNALATLTSTIQSNPSLALHEALLLNVCTLFELESSDPKKKEALLKEVAKYKGDGVNVSCLKLHFRR